MNSQPIVVRGTAQMSYSDSERTRLRLWNKMGPDTITGSGRFLRFAGLESDEMQPDRDIHQRMILS